MDQIIADRDRLQHDLDASATGERAPPLSPRGREFLEHRVLLLNRLISRRGAGEKR
jgi:hypothetical protein